MAGWNNDFFKITIYAKNKVYIEGLNYETGPVAILNKNEIPPPTSRKRET